MKKQPKQTEIEILLRSFLSDLDSKRKNGEYSELLNKVRKEIDFIEGRRRLIKECTREKRWLKGDGSDSKININNPAYYPPIAQRYWDRTKKRLMRMAEIKMEEIGGDFGYKGVSYSGEYQCDFCLSRAILFFCSDEDFENTVNSIIKERDRIIAESNK